MNKYKIFMGIVCFICILYLLGSTTLSSYQSRINSRLDSSIAGWKILVNNSNITDLQTESIDINSVNWSGEHVRENKIAPGSSGTITLDIDPTGTDVSIKFYLYVEDSVSNSDVILTVDSVDSNDVSIIHTDNYYTGIISLSQIRSGLKPKLVINASWINDEENNERDSLVDDTSSFLNLSFRAEQYMGE